MEAGNAVADVVYGKVNPGGKLPVSFPRNVGQVPIYYNHKPTGRPCDPKSKYNSRHRDIRSCDPLYEFGYGLSYTTFKVSNLRLSTARVNASRGTVTASADVTNTGARAGDEVAQLYSERPGGEHLAAGAASARLPACGVAARADEDGELDARP